MAHSEHCITETSSRLPFNLKLIVGAALLALVAIAVAARAAGPHLAGYLTVFGLSALASSWLFVPSGRLAIMITAALVLNPLAVAILGSAGGTIGELVGYGLGRSSRRVIKADRLTNWVLSKAQRYMAPTLLVASVIPNPCVDAIGIMAGRVQYPVWKFLVCTFAGKVVQSIILVHLALWNIALFTTWLGWG